MSLLAIYFNPKFKWKLGNWGFCGRWLITAWFTWFFPKTFPTIYMNLNLKEKTGKIIISMDSKCFEPFSEIIRLILMDFIVIQKDSISQRMEKESRKFIQFSFFILMKPVFIIHWVKPQQKKNLLFRFSGIPLYGLSFHFKFMTIFLICRSNWVEKATTDKRPSNCIQCKVPTNSWERGKR